MEAAAVLMAHVLFRPAVIGNLRGLTMIEFNPPKWRGQSQLKVQHWRAFQAENAPQAAPMLDFLL